MQKKTTVIDIRNHQTVTKFLNVGEMALGYVIASHLKDILLHFCCLYNNSRHAFL